MFDMRSAFGTSVVTRLAKCSLRTQIRRILYSESRFATFDIRPPMKSFAQCLDLNDDPDMIAAYIRHHQAVYPEVVAALKAIGITTLKIYLLGNRLFMYFEAPDTFDPARDYQEYARDPRCRRWDELMRTFQKKAPGAKPGEWWADMQLVFGLD